VKPISLRKKTRSLGEASQTPGTPKFHLSRMPPENGSIGVRITWLPNVESGRPGSSFFVKYRKKGEVNFKSVPKKDTLDPVTIEGLDAGETYEFRVVSAGGQETAESETEEVSMTGIGGYGVDAQESRGTFNKSGWFIGMICAISLALVAAIMVCIVKRNRGGKYTVQDKEQRYGRNPLDYRDDSGGFADFSPKSVDVRNPFQESNTSFNADEYGDEESLEGDGDDPSKFEEDGSFIGEYSTNTYLKTKKKREKDPSKFEEDNTFIGQYSKRNQPNVGNPTFV